jgi:hypothetical protein
VPGGGLREQRLKRDQQPDEQGRVNHRDHSGYHHADPD